MHFKKTILITGGLGYIGSHTAILLLKKKFNLVIIDNLINSKKSVLSLIEKISKKKIIFYKSDIRNEFILNNIFVKHKIDAVIHFAALKYINESFIHKKEYFDVNVNGTLNLMTVMKKNNVKNIIFSSSAAVYGDPVKVPINEDAKIDCKSPYASTKFESEEIIRSFKNYDPLWRISILRYFNPIGAHESGNIGEDPLGEATNVMPLICKSALNQDNIFTIYGNDYDTYDGTGVRDYIHVMDLAEGHISALNYNFNNNDLLICNLGNGLGVSVLDLIKTFEEVNNVKIKTFFTSRRYRDSAEVYASTQLALKKLSWMPKKNLSDMCLDSWRWYSRSVIHN